MSLALSLALSESASLSPRHPETMLAADKLLLRSTVKQRTIEVCAAGATSAAAAGPLSGPRAPARQSTL